MVRDISVEEAKGRSHIAIILDLERPNKAIASLAPLLVDKRGKQLENRRPARIRESAFHPNEQAWIIA